MPNKLKFLMGMVTVDSRIVKIVNSCWTFTACLLGCFPVHKEKLPLFSGKSWGMTWLSNLQRLDIYKMDVVQMWRMLVNPLIALLTILSSVIWGRKRKFTECNSHGESWSGSFIGIEISKTEHKNDWLNLYRWQKKNLKMENYWEAKMMGGDGSCTRMSKSQQWW